MRRGYFPPPYDRASSSPSPLLSCFVSDWNAVNSQTWALLGEWRVNEQSPGFGGRGTILVLRRLANMTSSKYITLTCVWPGCCQATFHTEREQTVIVKSRPSTEISGRRSDATWRKTTRLSLFPLNFSVKRRLFLLLHPSKKKLIPIWVSMYHVSIFWPQRGRLGSGH